VGGLARTGVLEIFSEILLARFMALPHGVEGSIKKRRIH
jgi:hypothetical protein